MGSIYRRRQTELLFMVEACSPNSSALDQSPLTAHCQPHMTIEAEYPIVFAPDEAREAMFAEPIQRIQSDPHSAKLMAIAR